MQKNSVFVAASFGDLLLNEKQKKPFVSLNNEVSEASDKPLAVRADTRNVLVQLKRFYCCCFIGASD